MGVPFEHQWPVLAISAPMLVGGCALWVAERRPLLARRLLGSLTLLSLAVSLVLLVGPDFVVDDHPGKLSDPDGASNVVWVSQLPLVDPRFLLPHASQAGWVFPGIIGIDRFVGWPLVLLAVVHWAVIWWHLRRVEGGLRPGALLSILFGLSNGVILLPDVVLQPALLVAWIVTFGVVLAESGGNDRRRLAVQVSGKLLVPVLLLTGCGWWFSSALRWTGEGQLTPLLMLHGPSIVASMERQLQVNEFAVEYWAQIGGWLLLALLITGALWWQVVPFHGMHHTLLQQSTSPQSACWLAMWFAMGELSWRRWIGPMFSESWGELSGWLTCLSLLGALYCALLALSQNDLRKTVAAICLSQLQLVVAAMCAAAPGERDALQLLMIGVLAASALALLLLSWLEERYGTLETNVYGGLLTKSPRWGALLFISLTALTGWPVGWHGCAWLGASFNWLAQGLEAFGVAAATTLILTWTVGWTLHRVLLGPLQEPVFDELFRELGGRPAVVTTGPSDLTRAEVVALGPLVALLMALSVSPGWMGQWPRIATPAAQEEEVSRAAPPVTVPTMTVGTGTGPKVTAVGLIAPTADQWEPAR